MRKLSNSIAGMIFEKRMKRIDNIRNHPFECQRKTFQYLITQLAQTEYGKRFKIRTNTKYQDFSSRVPLVRYEDIYPMISRMMMGEKNVLWPGKVSWFSKSSGTTNERSKFIPVPYINLRYNHYKGARDTMNLVYSRMPNSTIFGAKSIILGGSLERHVDNYKCRIGDVSAVMMYHMPSLMRLFFGMDFETALHPDWEVKINRIISKMAHKDIRMICGVPTWTIVLFERMIQHYGADHMFDIWSNLEVYIHGGVGFGPYQEQFKKYLPSDKMLYHEVYNASEGYFATQDNDLGEGMLLLLDNHVFYEFLPISEWESSNPKTVTLEDVEPDRQYGLIINSSSGLWRYIIGDTIQFTSIKPYRIKITGRMQQYINVFGEELMVGNTEEALSRVCEAHRVTVSEYMVAPVYMSEPGKGGHEWLIEFSKAPKSLSSFARDLDMELQALNSDYAAKRYMSMALSQLQIQSVEEGTFMRWMKSRGKFGGQNKIPRLSNDREMMEEVLREVELHK